MALSRPGDLEVPVSVGVSTAEGEDIVLERMLAEADRRPYEAKRSGRNAVAAPGISGPA